MMNYFNALNWEDGKLGLVEVDLDDFEADTCIGGKCFDSYFKVVIKEDECEFIPCDRETAEKFALA